ncbi:hypothetical protein D3C80_1693030 [compost metagenome]
MIGLYAQLIDLRLACPPLHQRLQPLVKTFRELQPLCVGVSDVGLPERPFKHPDGQCLWQFVAEHLTFGAGDVIRLHIDDIGEAHRAKIHRKVEIFAQGKAVDQCNFQ